MSWTYCPSVQSSKDWLLRKFLQHVMEHAMCRFLSFVPRFAGIAAATGNVSGLAIVPILAMMLACPARAQVNSDAESKSTGAAVVINIDKARQKMTVLLDGVEKYDWPVSTGVAGYSTPSGTYTATSMNEIWYSKEWDNAPMPHSIFFRKDGHAIHGSYEVKKLGKPASHGCVRISPENAATLYALVKKVGLKNTEVVLTGVTPGGEYKVARSAGPRYGQTNAGWNESNNYYAQPQWRDGFFARSFSGPYYNGPPGYHRPPPPRGY
jgi:hypothetical protein